MALPTPDPLFDVSDQVVIVSGGSRGIGRAIAQGFSERGARVILTGRDAATLQATCEELAHRAVHVPTGVVCDVAEAAEVERFVETVYGQFGHVDTLINVAGVNRRKPVEAVTLEDFDFIMDINLRGAFYLSQQVGLRMLQRGSGSHVNVASLNSDRPLKNVLPYAVSKAALAQMTKAFALEWGARGIRVNGLAPGFILTDLTHKLWSDPTMQAWGTANTPQRRLGTPADMIGTAIFLASPASAFMTGQILYVDGGFTAGWNWPIP